MARIFPAAAALLAVAGAAPALAQTAPVATAPPGAGAPAAADAPITTSDHAVLTTSEQIDRFIKEGAEQAPPAGEEGVDAPRKIHGEVGAAVGTGGYRSAYVRTDIPVGKTGTVSIAVGESRFNDRGRWRGGGRRWTNGSLAISGGAEEADAEHGPPPPNP